MTEHLLAMLRVGGAGQHRSGAEVPQGMKGAADHRPPSGPSPQFLSKQRTAVALAKSFATPVSAGTVAAMSARAAAGLGEFLDVVRGRIALAFVICITSWLRHAGMTNWRLVAASLAVPTIHRVVAEQVG